MDNQARNREPETAGLLVLELGFNSEVWHIINSSSLFLILKCSMIPQISLSLLCAEWQSEFDCTGMYLIVLKQAE